MGSLAAVPVEVAVVTLTADPMVEGVARLGVQLRGISSMSLLTVRKVTMAFSPIT